MTREKTTLIQKDSQKVTTPNNYWPITCLSMMQKILTAQIIISQGLFCEEQKRCHRETRGRGDLLYIDKHILNDSKTKRKNVALARINCKKAYYIVPQNCLKIYNITDKVMKFIKKTMNNRSGIDWRRKRFSWGENPERDIPGRCVVIFTIWCHSTTYLGNTRVDTNFLKRKKRSIT